MFKPDQFEFPIGRVLNLPTGTELSNIPGSLIHRSYLGGGGDSGDSGGCGGGGFLVSILFSFDQAEDQNLHYVCCINIHQNIT